MLLSCCFLPHLRLNNGLKQQFVGFHWEHSINLLRYHFQLFYSVLKTLQKKIWKYPSYDFLNFADEAYLKRGLRNSILKWVMNVRIIIFLYICKFFDEIQLTQLEEKSTFKSPKNLVWKCSLLRSRSLVNNILLYMCCFYRITTE